MKYIYILIALTFCSVNTLRAQDLTDVITGVTTPHDIVVVGNDLYIASGASEIYKVDLTEEIPAILHVAYAGYNFGLAINGNDLYIAESIFDPQISKLDITATLPTNRTTVIQTDDPTHGLVLHNNNLYYSNGLRISKIDVSDVIPTSIDIVTGLVDHSAGLVFNGDDLYFAQPISGKISKISITDSTPIAIEILTGLSSPFGLAMHGNELYFGESATGKISKINITDITPIVTEVIIGLGGPVGLFIDNNNLYIAELGANKVSKYPLPSLSVEEIPAQNLIISPNPAEEYIKIQGLNTVKEYRIYNILGIEVLKGYLSDNGSVQVKSLNNGLHFIVLEGNTTIKFIKR
jgi:hypothetical protein